MRKFVDDLAKNLRIIAPNEREWIQSGQIVNRLVFSAVDHYVHLYQARGDFNSRRTLGGIAGRRLRRGSLGCKKETERYKRERNGLAHV